ncbi:metalloreductase STEAP4-like [Argonauta hians]
MEDMEMSARKPSEKPAIGILGTGDYGRALAKRMLRCGVRVIFGSRDPANRDLVSIDKELADAQLSTINDVLLNENIEIIILAVQHWNIEGCLKNFNVDTSKKIFIDISNNEKPLDNQSIAEIIACKFPGMRVVKAFNTLSAYAVESDNFGGSRRVFIATDDIEAREKVSRLCCEIGFESVSYGSLKAARELEAYPTRLMQGWGKATICTIIVFLIWFVFVVIKYVYIYNKYNITFRWDNIPMRFLNKPVCMTAITLLTFSYLPGCLAAFLQIYNGSKYVRFPNFLDLWLKSRKALGLYALLFSLWHVVISTICMSPGYYGGWFQNTYVTLPENTTDFRIKFKSPMNLRGEANVSVGVLAILCMIVIGLSSLPSVGDILNWREWKFVQSHLGYITLLLATIHVLIFSFPYWIKRPSSLWRSGTFLSTFLAMVTLFLKLLLLMPCIGNYVYKIRSGWERKKSPKVCPAVV